RSAPSDSATETHSFAPIDMRDLTTTKGRVGLDRPGQIRSTMRSNCYRVNVFGLRLREKTSVEDGTPASPKAPRKAKRCFTRCLLSSLRFRHWREITV